MKFYNYDINLNQIHVISLSCNPVPPICYGGIELIVANLCEGLAECGAKVFCYSPGEFNLKNVTHVKTLSKPSLQIKDGGVPNSLDHLKSICFNLKKISRNGDIVLLNHSDHYKYIKKNISLFSLFKVNFYEVAHWLNTSLKNNIIYPSQSLKSSIKKNGFVIPHGINLIYENDFFHSREDYLFFAGRITKDKGVDIALSGAKRLGVKLFLAGPLNDRKFADTILSDDAVCYLGELPYIKLFDYYRCCRAMIYMTQYVEPFGLSVIEAMAAGAPVITTGRGGTGETVVHGRTGFFAETGDQIVSAYKQIHLIKSQDCVERARLYTISAMAKNYLSVFQNNYCNFNYIVRD